jgi:hypothetical protein
MVSRGVGMSVIVAMQKPSGIGTGLAGTAFTAMRDNMAVVRFQLSAIPVRVTYGRPPAASTGDTHIQVGAARPPAAAAPARSAVHDEQERADGPEQMPGDGHGPSRTTLHAVRP